MISHTVYIWHPIHCIYDIISTRYDNTTLCGITLIWHKCDIICTTDDITSTLSHQTIVFMISHALQAWHYTHCIRLRTHCIFVITNSPLISYPILYDIISTLYDIIPTIYVTPYAFYLTSYQFLMSSHYCVMTSQPLYMKPHPVFRATYTLYMWHHSH